MVERGQTWGSALTVDDGHGLMSSVIKDNWHFAAEAEESRVGDAQGKDRGGGRVGCVSACLQDLEPAATAPSPPAATAP